jgi:hypothetical protein
MNAIMLYVSGALTSSLTVLVIGLRRASADQRRAEELATRKSRWSRPARS